MTDLTKKRALRAFPSDKWLDTDDAMYQLAVILGLMAGILEHSGNEGSADNEFRWNGAFVGSWEPDLISILAQLVSGGLHVKKSKTPKPKLKTRAGRALAKTNPNAKASLSLPKNDAPDPRAPSLGVLVKLGSIAVHADEILTPPSPNSVLACQSCGSHPFDKAAVEQLLNDPGVRAWLAAMDSVDERATIDLTLSTVVCRALRSTTTWGKGEHANWLHRSTITGIIDAAEGRRGETRHLYYLRDEPGQLAGIAGMLAQVLRRAQALAPDLPFDEIAKAPPFGEVRRVLARIDDFIGTSPTDRLARLALVQVRVSSRSRDPDQDRNDPR